MMISSEGSSPVSTSPKAEQSNLLEQILRECCDADEMNSASLPDSTLFVLGRNCQGKTILLNELAGSSHSNEMKRDYVLEYGSMKLQQEEKHTGITGGLTGGFNPASGHVDLWHISHPAHAPLLLNPLLQQFQYSFPPSSSSSSTSPSVSPLAHAVVLITLNLEDPARIKADLTAWLQVAKHLSQQALQTLSPTQRQAQYQHVSSLVQHISLGSNHPTSNHPENPSLSSSSLLDLKIPEHNLGLPVIISGVGAGSLKTRLQSGLVETNHRARVALCEEQTEYICRWIRRVALDHGAAVLFTSCFPRRLKLPELRRFLKAALYNLPFNGPACCQLHVEGENMGLCVPFGLDSTEAVELHPGYSLLTRTAQDTTREMSRADPHSAEPAQAPSPPLSWEAVFPTSASHASDPSCPSAATGVQSRHTHNLTDQQFLGRLAKKLKKQQHMNDESPLLSREPRDVLQVKVEAGTDLDARDAWAGRGSLSSPISGHPPVNPNLPVGGPDLSSSVPLAPQTPDIKGSRLGSGSENVATVANTPTHVTHKKRDHLKIKRLKMMNKKMSTSSSQLQRRPVNGQVESGHGIQSVQSVQSVQAASARSTKTRVQHDMVRNFLKNLASKDPKKKSAMGSHGHGGRQRSLSRKISKVRSVSTWPAQHVNEPDL